ncbi:MAG TPA: hypothetical protein VFU31_20795, partial [Candidatus Binatia bacterium]|nr:hypothetical protein [Candidatus Binatia bacterium]
MIFLLQYDRKKGAIRKLKSFPAEERAEAQRERLAIELDLRKSRVLHEVVLLEAGDEQTLRRTHQRYFKSPRELVELMMMIPTR